MEMGIQMDRWVWKWVDGYLNFYTLIEILKFEIQNLFFSELRKARWATASTTKVGGSGFMGIL